MFAENGKISYRQLRRLYVFNLLGVGTLVIPTEIALLGKYGFVAITLGFVMEVLFLAVVSKIKKWYLKSKIAGLVIYVYEVLLGAFLAWVFVDLIRYSLIPDEWFAVAGIDKKDGQYEFYYSIDNATEPVYADGIEEAVNECESGLSKTADTNHLKVLLIGNELYDDENSYAKLIQYLKDSSKFPRNTYVCAVDDINKTFENMGDYYEQLLEKQEREEGLCLTTVGDIMDEYTNGL